MEIVEKKIDKKESIKNKVRKKIRKYKHWIFVIIVILSIVAVVLFSNCAFFLPLGGDIT